jgi:hypothetical protein
MADKVKAFLKAQYDKAQAFTFEYTKAHIGFVVAFVAGFALGVYAAW